MPAVLVELGFLSNPEEETKLQDPEYRGALIAALTRAIQRYKAQVENRPDPTATPAPTPGTGTPSPAPATPQSPRPGGGPGTP